MSSSAQQQVPTGPSSQPDPVSVPRFHIDVEDPSLLPSIEQWERRGAQLAHQWRSTELLNRATDVYQRLDIRDQQERERILLHLSNDPVRQDALHHYWDNRDAFRRARETEHTLNTLASHQREQMRLFYQQRSALTERLLYLGIADLDILQHPRRPSTPITNDGEVYTTAVESEQGVMPLLEEFGPAIHTTDTDDHRYHTNGQICIRWTDDEGEDNCRCDDCQDMVDRRRQRHEDAAREVYRQLADSDQSR